MTARSVWNRDWGPTLFPRVRWPFSIFLPNVSNGKSSDLEILPLGKRPPLVKSGRQRLPLVQLRESLLKRKLALGKGLLIDKKRQEGILVKSMGFGISQAWVQIMDLSLSYVTWKYLFKSPTPQFPLLWTWHNTNHLIGLLRNFYDVL